MIICDLEHYEIDSQVNQIKKLKGGFFGFIVTDWAFLSNGFFTAAESKIDVLNQQGDPFTGLPTTTGFEFKLSSMVSSMPINIGMPTP